ncbi:MAG TPA: hypothetical protein VGX23_09270 [Actinocrinis sp.]|nr:hypothetical protein [Actinocrinis sp.]
MRKPAPPIGGAGFLPSSLSRKKPELLADGPGQVWSWDITKLRGPVKGVWP